MSRQPDPDAQVHPLIQALFNWRQSLITVAVLLIWGGAVWVFGDLK